MTDRASWTRGYASPLRQSKAAEGGVCRFGTGDDTIGADERYLAPGTPPWHVDELAALRNDPGRSLEQAMAEACAR